MPYNVRGGFGGSLNTTIANGENINVAFGDSGNLDAFGRLRISEPFTIFDSKQLNDKQPLFWDEATNGTATSVHSTTDADTVMTVKASGDYVKRQTFMRFNYQPGKSQLLLMTASRFEPQTNVSKYIGQYVADAAEDAPKDGLGFSSLLGIVYVNLYKNGSVERVAQTNWNLDTMDGSGDQYNPSGIQIDFSKTNIYVIDYEWLGVGRVRMGFNIDGVTYYVHQFLNANVKDSVYISSPNLPLQYFIKQTGSGSGVLNHICSTVISEGGIQDNGVVLSADRGISQFSTANNTLIYPLLSLRLRDGYTGTTINPLEANITLFTAADFRWAIYLNPTIAGSDAASWTAANSASSIEYDISRDNTNTLSAGTQISSGYIRGSSGNLSRTITQTLDSPLRLGVAIDGTKDEYVFAVQNVSAGAETYLASLTWRELL